MRRRLYILLTVLALIALLPATPAQAGTTNVIVSFSTSNSTPLNPGLAGFSFDPLGDAVEYYDTNFQNITATLSPGWLRYPGGATEDAFYWPAGTNRTDWFADFPEQEQVLLNDTTVLCPGKGGAQFTDFAAMCANVGGARIVVTINAFTDDTNSAGAFAAFALSNHISVAAWELCNEPYVMAGTNSLFWANATQYASKMKPYRDAIKAADPNAVVAVYYDDAGQPFPNNWDNDLANYTNQFWDAVVYHHYPKLPGNASFANLMALDNWQLASNTTAHVNYLTGLNKSNVTYLISEFAPAMGDGTGGQNPPTATLYGGIYTAEYVLRLSSMPQMTFVGPYQLLDDAGIALTNNEFQPVQKAVDQGRTTNTAGLPFGYYLSAQVCGSAVVNWALTRSTAVYATSPITNGPVVPIDTNGIATIPAIYAQACAGGNGRRYVLLTNKGSNAAPVEIFQDSVELTNALLETYVSGSDPAATNLPPPAGPVEIQTATVTNPVMIPGYSVVRLEWSVFTAPRPMLSVTVMNAAPTLHWAGLTNVVYNVQATTNVEAPTWATLAKVTSAQTNFSFTDPNTGPVRFYRLVVP